MKRNFSAFNMLLLSINGMIGSAWLFAPFYSAKLAGPASLIAWLIGGFMTVAIALTFAEVSTFLPVAGGTTRLSELSHGSLTSFMIGWIAWLASVTMPPIEVQAVLQYASTYFPILMHEVNHAEVLTGVGMIFATLLMLGLCIINIVSFKGIVRFNNLLFSFKCGVIVLTIFSLVYTQFNGHNFHQTISDTHYDYWKGILSAVASGGIVFAFTGFKHGVELAGETKNPQRSVPLALIGSVLTCLLLYMGLQLAFIGSIDHQSILTSGWQNLTFAGDIGPFAGIATLLGLYFLLKLLLIDAAVSPLGAGLVYVTSTARIVYAMSKKGYIPSFFSQLNQNGLPMNAIFLNFAVGMMLFLPLPGWQNMVNFLVSTTVIAYAMGPISLISLRKTFPTEKRKFRLPFANLQCIIALYFCNLINYWTGWETISKLSVAAAIGFALYALILFKNGKKGLANRSGLRSFAWILPYFIGLIMISYYGSFGGTNLIPFGWDFAVIGIFTLCIFYLAVKCRIPEEKKNLSQYGLDEESIALLE